MKTTKIRLLDLSSVHMVAFHFSWFSFFICFFGWFAFPAMAKWVIEDLGITKSQFVTTSQWAVGSTIFVRLAIGALGDKFGPRRTYTWLLALGAIPVFLSAFVQNYEQLFAVRIFVGAIGASFVLTQFHTSLMFAPNVVGTANATTAGWGNLGGGVTQQLMPLFLLGFAFFLPEEIAWRCAMVIPAVVMLITAYLYHTKTQDTPEGDWKSHTDGGKRRTVLGSMANIFVAMKDPRIFILFVLYGTCFGVELVVNSQIALYLIDDISLDRYVAAPIAASFGLMNIFARSLGGIFGDKFGNRYGLNGRVAWLFIALFFEGLALMLFSQTKEVAYLLPALILFSLFVQMSEGATYSIVPFLNKKLLGVISGIIGAGGNAGAVLGLMLFKIEGWTWSESFFYLGAIVTGCSFLSAFVRFSKEERAVVAKEKQDLLAAAEK